VNAILMESVSIPQNVRRVIIWADNDKSETGQRAAQKLQERLFAQGVQVSIWKPLMPFAGKSLDWNDALVSVDFEAPAFVRRGGMDAAPRSYLH